MSQGLPVSVIIDSRKKAWCEGECGLDWSKRDNQLMAEQAVQTRFGSTVDLTFCDLATSGSCGLLVNAEENDAGTPGLPVLAIDGQPRITGLFDVRMMCLVVEAALENNDV